MCIFMYYFFFKYFQKGCLLVLFCDWELSDNLILQVIVFVYQLKFESHFESVACNGLEKEFAKQFANSFLGLITYQNGYKHS